MAWEMGREGRRAKSAGIPIMVVRATIALTQPAELAKSRQSSRERPIRKGSAVHESRYAPGLRTNGFGTGPPDPSDFGKRSSLDRLVMYSQVVAVPL